MAVDINQNQLTKEQIVKNIASIAITMEANIGSKSAADSEKIDFLIFMASKRVNLKDTLGVDKEVVISGEELFRQWKAGVEKARIAAEKVNGGTHLIPDEQSGDLPNNQNGDGNV